MTREELLLQERNRMKKIVLVYGLIAGVIVGGMFFITIPLYESGKLDLSNGELIGYTTMVLALSLIFFGVKSYRDKQLDGSITFGNSLIIGLLITVVASAIYVLSWEIIYQNMYPDFMEKITEHYMQQKIKSGGTDEEITKLKKEMNGYAEMYKSMPFRMALTFAEIAPVGIIISLISAALLRKKKFLPATENVQQE